MIDEAKALNTAFDATGITFHNRAESLAAFKESREIVYDDDGYDSEPLLLADALARFAYDNRQYVDARTLPREGVGASRPGTLSKSDLDLKGKLEFIKTHGGAAYEALPLKSQPTREVKTREDWYRLPRAERVRLTGKDPDFLANYPPLLLTRFADPSSTTNASPARRPFEDAKQDCPAL